MKKKVKKLALSKDTVLWLAEEKLPAGARPNLTPLSCDGTCGFDTCRIDVCMA